MDKFTAKLTACAVFASFCFGAVAEESQDAANQWKHPGGCASANLCQDQVSYVSGKGKDVGECKSPSNPCRTFQYAVDHTAAGGEVKALDPANYFPVTIRKSITLTGVDGAGIDIVSGRAVDAVTEVGASYVHIDNLIIQNLSGPSNTGATAIFGVYISISHCTVRGFNVGISIGLNGSFLISDTTLTNNGTAISLSDVHNGTLDHVIANSNRAGLQFQKGTIQIIDSSFTDNGIGIKIGFGNLYLAHSTVSGNGVGVDISRAFVTSFGDNHLKGNGNDVVSDPPAAGITNVGTQ